MLSGRRREQSLRGITTGEKHVYGLHGTRLTGVACRSLESRTRNGPNRPARMYLFWLAASSCDRADYMGPRARVVAKDPSWSRAKRLNP